LLQDANKSDKVDARKMAAITLAVWKGGENFDGGTVMAEAAWNRRGPSGLKVAAA
jgi:hypothetical protein